MTKSVKIVTFNEYTKDAAERELTSLVNAGWQIIGMGGGVSGDSTPNVGGFIVLQHANLAHGATAFEEVQTEEVQAFMGTTADGQPWDPRQAEGEE